MLEVHASRRRPFPRQLTPTTGIGVQCVFPTHRISAERYNQDGIKTSYLCQVHASSRAMRANAASFDPLALAGYLVFEQPGRGTLLTGRHSGRRHTGRPDTAVDLIEASMRALSRWGETQAEAAHGQINVEELVRTGAAIVGRSSGGCQTKPLA